MPTYVFFKHIVKSKSWPRRMARGVVLGLYYSGILPLYAGLRRRPGAIVLMYHSVAAQEQAKWVDPDNHVPPEAFEAQMRFLAAKRNVISLTRLIRMMQQGQSAEPGSVVITFDDGYLDNLTVAAPILAKHELPATVFLATGQIDRGETQWIDELFSAFRYRTRDQLTVPSPAAQTADLRIPGQLQAVFRELCGQLMTAEYPVRRATLDAVIEQMQPSARPSRLTMTWDDVQRLQDDYPLIEIGGHTVNHTDMSQLDEHAAIEELASCRQRIQQMTGVTPLHFSFPYGRSSPQLKRSVQATGFESCCGGGRDVVFDATSDRFALRRLAIPPADRHFAFQTSRVNSGLLHKIVR
jgi:peptidoglycan/xylan/chitin deacetylase (PgdA/CDA1 family)